MSRAYFEDVIQDQQGNAIAGAQISVLDSNNVLLTLYQDNSSNNTFANPLLSAADGSFWFYLASPQIATLSVSFSGQTAVRSVPVADPTGGTTTVSGPPLPHASTHATGGTNVIVGSMDANARVSVYNNGTFVATRRAVNLIPGTNVTLTVVDNAGAERVDVTVTSSGGGGSPARQGYVTKASAYSVLSSDVDLGGDATGGAFSFTMPDAGTITAGETFRFVRVNSGTNAVTVAAFAGQNINGQTTYVLDQQWSSITLERTDNTTNHWVIV